MEVPGDRPTHFLGIGGIGMSALAHIMLERGKEVYGLDGKESQIIRDLRAKGARIFIGEEAQFDSTAQIVYSSSIKESHPALQAAKRLNCPVYHRSVCLSMLMEGKKSLLIAGTHGKTSTTALLSWVLNHAGLQPSYAVGGILRNTNKNGGHGAGPHFVAEADESDGSFLNYKGHYGIITNIEQEHMNYWKTESALHEGFRSFASRVEKLFWCADDPSLLSLKLAGQSYGTSNEADWKLFDVHHDNLEVVFSIAHDGQSFEKIRLPIMGAHQALNATAVWAVAYKLGLAQDVIRKAFLSFCGVHRRLEKKGEVRGIIVYDDYAHHPTEVAAILVALKQAMKDSRVKAIFQAHKYTRTRDCLHLFAAAFQSADDVYITEIYSAGEQPIEGITGQTLSMAIPGSRFMTEDEILEDLKMTSKSGDVIVTIGAGSITFLGPKILNAL